MVGFEPTTSSTPVKCATKLRHILLVPAKGVEPIRHSWHWFLRPACLPFHHTGMCRVMPSHPAKVKHVKGKNVLYKKLVLPVHKTPSVDSVRLTGFEPARPNRVTRLSTSHVYQFHHRRRAEVVQEWSDPVKS